MELTFQSVIGFIKHNVLCDFRTALLSICIAFGLFFFFKLLKYDNSKPAVSLKYLTIVVLCGVIFMLMY